MDETCFFTVVDPVDEHENKIHFTTEKEGPFGKTNILLTIRGKKLRISPEQMTELGALFIALGGGKVDPDDVGELFDGYELGLRINSIEEID